MSNREKCLHLLRQQEWVTTNDFLRAGCGSRFGARLLELRKQGYEIETEPVREGQARYRLKSGDGGSSNQPNNACFGTSRSAAATSELQRVETLNDGRGLCSPRKPTEGYGSSLNGGAVDCLAGLTGPVGGVVLDESDEMSAGVEAPADPPRLFEVEPERSNQYEREAA